MYICKKERYRSSARLINSQLTLQQYVRVMTNLSNICLMTRKQRAMGKVAHRSCGLGKTFPSWFFRSAHPWPSGNQIQSAHTSSLSRDNILTGEQHGFVSHRRKLKSTKRKVFHQTHLAAHSTVTISCQEREETEKAERNKYWLQVINLNGQQQQALHLGTSCSSRAAMWGA